MIVLIALYELLSNRKEMLKLFQKYHFSLCTSSLSYNHQPLAAHHFLVYFNDHSVITV